jgi:hypothetical protein
MNTATPDANGPQTGAEGLDACDSPEPRAIDEYSYPWAQTVDTVDGGRTIRIPGLAADGTEAGGLTVSRSDAAALGAMLAEHAVPAPAIPAKACCGRRIGHYPGCETNQPVSEPGLHALRARLAEEHRTAARNAGAARVPEVQYVHDGIAAGLDIALGWADQLLRDPAPEPGLRERYAAAIRYWWDDDDQGAAEIADVVLAVRDAELEQLRAERDASDDAARRILAQRQEMAAERYAWQERGDRAEVELKRLREESPWLRATAEDLADAKAAIARVRALRADWLSTGAPPLGTSIARWWDKRLIELAAALDQPQDQPNRCCEARIGHLPTCPANQPQEQS